MRHRLVYHGLHTDKSEQYICLDMAQPTAARFFRCCKEEGISPRTVRLGGMPHWLRLYRRRFGMLIGILLGTAILISSSRVLWDIRISGNERMTVRQVRRELAASGLHIGMPLAALDVKDMEMQIQLDSDRISWVSLNMSGTVVYAEIRELVPAPDRAPLQPANLVARCEGIVEGLEIFAGNTVVKVGQAVQQGELLVSGIYDSQALGWRVTRAAGKVLARTRHEFLVEIPWKYEQKVYTGERISQKKMFFFEKEIKLFKNSSILGASCDKINKVDSFTLANGVSLPFSVGTEQYFPYEYREAVRDHAQAQALAYDELGRQIAHALPDAVLLKKDITVALTDEAFEIRCTVHALEDIAEVKEFSVDEIQ